MWWAIIYLTFVLRQSECGSCSHPCAHSKKRSRPLERNLLPPYLRVSKFINQPGIFFLVIWHQPPLLRPTPLAGSPFARTTFVACTQGETTVSLEPFNMVTNEHQCGHPLQAAPFAHTTFVACTEWDTTAPFGPLNLVIKRTIVVDLPFPFLPAPSSGLGLFKGKRAHKKTESAQAHHGCFWKAVKRQK